MSEDVRNSLTAWTSVLLWVGICGVALMASRDIEIPTWVIWLGVALAAVEMFLVVRQRQRQKRLDGDH